MHDKNPKLEYMPESFTQILNKMHRIKQKDIIINEEGLMFAINNNKEMSIKIIDPKVLESKY